MSFGRAVIPNWTLFDRPGAVPRLWIRTSNREWWEWRPVYRRSLLNLFSNGPGNLNLAYVSTLERLLQPNATPALLESSPDFALIRELARQLASDADPKAKYQFRIDVFDPAGSATEPYLLSPEYRI